VGLGRVQQLGEDEQVMAARRVARSTYCTSTGWRALNTYETQVVRACYIPRDGTVACKYA
jgi:hypothetical protein